VAFRGCYTYVVVALVIAVGEWKIVGVLLITSLMIIPACPDGGEKLSKHASADGVLFASLIGCLVPCVAAFMAAYCIVGTQPTGQAWWSALAMLFLIAYHTLSRL